jgi:signal transduction histidine kinase
MTARTHLRVLLVEDSPDDAELVLAALRRDGFEPEWQRVDNAAEMRAALQRSRWDVVLCDFAMPRFDALAALEVLKAESLDVPFIIVSGTMGEETAVSAMQAGAHDFFSKDRLTRLPAAIERELREAGVRSERKKMQEQLLLSDRLVAVGTLAAGVAHEINNPLAYVIGNIDLALERLQSMSQRPGYGDEVTDTLASLRQAREGAERIRVTARDLKVFCRSDEERSMSVDVELVLESAIRMAWNEIRHRANLVRDYRPLPRVEGNENRLAQVFLNLLLNAAQAFSAGTIAEQEIRVITRHAGDRVSVEVKDTGSGMSQEVQKRLFEPFFTTKPIGAGTGLGMPICSGIINDLGGEISVTSQVGVGTSVRVELPIGKAAVSSKEPPATEQRSRGARILMIDDEPALCHLVQRLLSPEHQVIAQTGAKLALELLQADPAFDVILCDLMMPEMTGMDFYAELHRRSPALASKVVFLTGGAFTSNAAKFLDSVPNRRIDKPFTAAILKTAIAKTLAS